MKYRVGIDVGGTFTDFASVNEEGRIVVTKSSSTPHDLSIGTVDTIVKSGIDMKEVTFVSHGSTVGVNTVIHNKGYLVAMITT